MTAPLNLIRIRILNALQCPGRIMPTALTVASFMENRDSARLGHEPLAALMGHTGQWKFAQRAIRDLVAWERRANIQLCEWIPGKRNVRQVTEFRGNNLNAAALFISQKLRNDEASTLEKIDEHVDAAISQFIKQPLAVAAQKTKQATKALPRIQTAHTSGSSASLFASVAQGLIDRYRVFPVNAVTKKPLVWNWKQAANQNPAVIAQWDVRFSDAAVGIATGGLFSEGRFLTVLDKDLHGPTFGNGFKTVDLRSQDLGQLPRTFTVTTPRNGEHCYFLTSKPLKTTTSFLGPGLDVKSRYGFVIAPGSYGYAVSTDAPIAWLPQAWENALSVSYETKRRYSEGERHDYLRGVAFKMAIDAHSKAEILNTLRQRLAFNCVAGDRPITDDELEQLAASAVVKVARANKMLDLIVA